MRVKYDFHIHTALSPCADNDMTPNNIINMSVLKGLDVIAVTDHNSCGNIEVLVNVGKKNGLTVIPGMEAETSEAAHFICLFPDTASAKYVAGIVYSRLPDIKNRADIFGRQLYMDENDNIIKEEEKLLINSAGITVYELFSTVREIGGIIYPAHADRESYSIISSLGTIPEDLNVKMIEISQNPREKNFLSGNSLLKNYKILKSSDAHRLENISEGENEIEIEELSAKSIIECLKKCEISLF